MRLKAVTGIVLTVLLIGMLALAFDIQPVEASGTIYIRADGSIDPPTANITSANNVTYYFTDNIYDEIVVERDNIVVDGDSHTVQGTGSGTGIDLSYRSNVTIKNVEIKEFGCGICLHESSNNTVSGNIMTNASVCLYPSSNNNTVSGNNITNRASGEGVYLYRSSFNTVSGNNITAGHDYYGVWLDRSNSNIISGNNIANSERGVGIKWSSNNNIISRNNITANDYDGIYLYDSSNNAIIENNIIHNAYGTGHYGVWLESSSSNTISGNNITRNNNYGVCLYPSSNNNTVSGNIIKDNTVRGVFIQWSSDNKFYHNIIYNYDPVFSYESTNVWDDGYPSGGNYWSDYTGVDEKSGPNQDQPGSDGIGDTPYVIDENNTDRYPFMNPWVTIEAYCYTEGTSVSVSIKMDVSLTPYTTPHTFTGLTGTHNFTVPNTDPHGHPFKKWSTGETSTTIAVTSVGTYTAYYQVGIYDVAVTSIKAWPTAAPQGEPVYINVTVENQGDFAETFDVDIYADRIGGSPHIDIETRTVSLDIGESKLLEFVWDTTGVPYGSYWITAEAILPEDVDPSDNIARTLVGGICHPHHKPEVNILALLAPTISAILTLITLGIAAIALLKILKSPRLRWPWRLSKKPASHNSCNSHLR